MEAPSTSGRCSTTCLTPPVHRALHGRVPQRTASVSFRWQQRHTVQLTGHRLSRRDAHIIRGLCRRRHSPCVAAAQHWPASSRAAESSSEAEPGAANTPRLRSLCLCLGLTLALTGLTAWLPRSALASLAISTTAITREGLRAAVRSAWAGLGAGFLHTLSGPDHLAALTPLTIGRSNVRATMLGALWGFGHSIGQLILGLLMVLLKDRFTSLVPALTKYGSTTVGVTLLVIGMGGLYETWAEGAEAAAQQPALAGAGAGASPSFEGFGDRAGSGAGASTSGREAAIAESAAESVDGSSLRTLFTGIVFGLQPDALFVIVPALALPTKLAALAYILMFVFGTVAAMGSYTAFIGATSSTLQKNYAGLCSKLSGLASVVAIGIGAAVLAAGWGVRMPFV